MEDDSSPIILKTDMPDKVQKLAIECAKYALLNFNDDSSSMAEYIKNEFDKRYGAFWACFVGNKFGSFFSYADKTYISFCVNDVLFLLFKYP